MAAAHRALTGEAGRDTRQPGCEQSRADRRRASILVTGAETGGRFALVETIEVRGAEPPRHLHHGEDETLYVVEGELRVWLAGQWHDAPAGSALTLSRGVEHGCAVVTEEARVLTVLAPAGFEGFHRELEEPRAGATLERLVITAARYDCEITGPPLGAGP